MTTSALERLLSKRLLFVSGKGGVGKSTVASALALVASGAGLRTLVCEIDQKGEIPRAFGQDPSGFLPKEVAPNLYSMQMDTEAALHEYVKVYTKFAIPARLGILARTFDFVSNAAPGVREILVVGKLCYEVRRETFDLIIVDAEASGHIVAQLSSPEGVGQLFSLGMVKEQTSWMTAILSDPHKTGILLVTTAEETPIEEAIELMGRIRSETVVNLAGIVANKVIPEIFSRVESETFESMAGLDRAARKGEEADGFLNLVAATKLWRSMAERGSLNLTKLRGLLVPEDPFAQVPLVSGVATSMEVISEVAETLEVEFGR